MLPPVARGLAHVTLHGVMCLTACAAAMAALSPSGGCVFAATDEHASRTGMQAADEFARPSADDLRAITVAAMAARDAPALARAVELARRRLGQRAGEPEVKDRYTPIPVGVEPLTADEARALARRSLSRLEEQRWWRVGLDPRQMGRPLREPAEVALGALALGEAAASDASRADALVIAREAGDFLLWAQAEAGSGLCPFPASRGVAGNAPFRASARFLDTAERAGRLGQVTHDGWIIEDDGDGGLQFDNGECGAALLALHAATGESRWLEAARRMGDWALAQPLSVNWNYNAFSVYLLATLYRSTGETRYLDGALDKARFGVIPGQLREGLHAGRWIDPHNARPAYHYILLRGLAALAQALPEDAPAGAEVGAALRRGLIARNRDFTGPGATNKDLALQTLLMVQSGWRGHPEFLAGTGTDAALAALERLAAQQWRAGRDPLAPRAAGLLLMRAAGRGSGHVPAGASDSD